MQWVIVPPQVGQACFSEPVLKKVVTALSQSGQVIVLTSRQTVTGIRPEDPMVVTQTVLHLSHMTAWVPAVEVPVD